jgi:hypothetical protein
VGRRHRRGRGAFCLRSRRVRWRDDLLLRRGRPGQPSRRRVRQLVHACARVALPLERAGAGEDGGVVRRLAPVWRPHAGRLRERRGRRVRRQESVAVAELPARTRDPARDLPRSEPGADRDRSRAHRDRRARRLPSAGEARNRRLGAGGAARDDRPGGPCGRRVPRGPHERRRGGARRARRGAGRRVRRALRRRRPADPRRGAADRRGRQRLDVRGLGDPAAGPTASCAPT